MAMVTFISNSWSSLRLPKSTSVLIVFPSLMVSGKRVSKALHTSPSLINANLKKKKKLSSRLSVISIHNYKPIRQNY